MGENSEISQYLLNPIYSNKSSNDDWSTDGFPNDRRNDVKFLGLREGVVIVLKCSSVMTKQDLADEGQVNVISFFQFKRSYWSWNQNGKIPTFTLNLNLNCSKIVLSSIHGFCQSVKKYLRANETFWPRQL